MEPDNKKMAKCFHLGLALWFAAALNGASAEPPLRKLTTTIRPDARTGRLVRAVVVKPRAVAPVEVRRGKPAARTAETPALASSFHETVERIAYEHALPVQLMHSVIKVESNYNPYAVSPKGAMGLMQLIPATARRFGVSDVFNPVENMKGGARYLRYLLDLYDSYPLALAAYNAGEGAVARYGGVPPYPETRNYLVQVERAAEDARKQAPAAPPESRPEAGQTARPDPGYNKIYEVTDPDGRVRYVSR